MLFSIDIIVLDSMLACSDVVCVLFVCRYVTVIYIGVTCIWDKGLVCDDCVLCLMVVL